MQIILLEVHGTSCDSTLDYELNSAGLTTFVPSVGRCLIGSTLYFVQCVFSRGRPHVHAVSACIDLDVLSDLSSGHML